MRIEYIGVAFATFVYLLIDIYPSIKSLWAIFRSFSFWMLWAIFTVLNVIAWAALRVSVAAQINNKLDNQDLTSLVVIILATFCTLTILQSFSLKIGEYKFLDVSVFLENFRKSVLSAIGEQLAEISKRRQQRCADDIFRAFADKRQALRDEYANVMSFGGRALPEIGQELATLEEQAAAAHLSVERELALRIAKADIRRAEEFLARSKF